MSIWILSMVELELYVENNLDDYEWAKRNEVPIIMVT